MYIYEPSNVFLGMTIAIINILEQSEELILKRHDESCPEYIKMIDRCCDICEDAREKIYTFARTFCDIEV